MFQDYDQHVCSFLLFPAGLNEVFSSLLSLCTGELASIPKMFAWTDARPNWTNEPFLFLFSLSGVHKNVHYFPENETNMGVGHTFVFPSDFPPRQHI